jgi:hypothetical protein
MGREINQPLPRVYFIKKGGAQAVVTESYSINW